MLLDLGLKISAIYPTYRKCYFSDNTSYVAYTYRKYCFSDNTSYVASRRLAFQFHLSLKAGKLTTFKAANIPSRRSNLFCSPCSKYDLSCPASCGLRARHRSKHNVHASSRLIRALASLTGHLLGKQSAAQEHKHDFVKLRVNTIFSSGERGQISHNHITIDYAQAQEG